MATVHYGTMTTSGDSTHDTNPHLDLVDSTPEDLSEEAHRTNSELDKLRRQIEDVEKQKVWIEDLRRRNEELENGRVEMIDKLTRSLGTVQRETEDAHKRLEQLNAIHNSFTQHLRYIESINSKLWGREELPKELSKAISAIEDARADYGKAQAKIAVDVSGEPGAAESAEYAAEYLAAEEKSFGYWFRSGLGFTLPLLVFGVVALLLWLWATYSGGVSPR